MRYDFETMVDRNSLGSAKWKQMHMWNPDVKEDAVPLSVADMEFKNAPEIIDGLKKFLDQAILGYTIPYASYHEAIKSWMKRRHSFDIESSWLVGTKGIVTAIYSAVRCLTQEGEGVIIMPPVYHPFYSAINLNKRKLVKNPLIETDGYYSIDFDGLEELAKDPNNKLLIFCSPHNPVGRVWKREELERLAEICVKNDMIIIADEIHHDLVMPGYEHTVLATISDEIADRTITCTSPSKSFNLAGLGTSNIIISNEEIRYEFRTEIRRVSGGMLGILGYKTCELAYNEAEDWLEELILVINKNQKLVNAFFNDHFPKIKAPLIEGTYLQWLDFRALGLDNEKLKKFMHMDAEVFFNEGYIFGEEGSGYERINLAAPTRVIEETLEKLKLPLQKIYID